MNGAGQRKRHLDPLAFKARSAAHHAHGNQVNAPSAPNQSLAPQQMIQPLSGATSATKIDRGIDNCRPRASINAPQLSTARWAMEIAAACCGKVSGNFQTQIISALMKTEKTPYWNSPARFPQTHEYGLRSGNSR